MSLLATSRWFVSAAALVACNTEDRPASATAGATPEPARAEASPKPAERDSSGKVFACMIDKPTGRHVCEATQHGCQRDGCEQRAEAWCFPGIAARTEAQGHLHTMCVVDRAECDAWRQTFADVGFLVKGPCALLRPKNYVSAVEQYLNDK